MMTLFWETYDKLLAYIKKHILGYIIILTIGQIVGVSIAYKKIEMDCKHLQVFRIDDIGYGCKIHKP
jgi:uncharacterized membrane protein